MTRDTNKNPKRKYENTIGPNQNSVGARRDSRDSNRVSNISDKPQSLTSTRTPSTSTKPPSTSTRLPSTETNLQPASAKGSSEVNMKGVIKDMFDSLSRSGSKALPSSNEAQGHTYRKQAGVPLVTHHPVKNTNVKQPETEHVKQPEAEYVVVPNTRDDNNMDLDGPDQAPSGNKTTREGRSSSPHASRSSRTVDEAHLQLMQEKAKEDHRKELDEVYENFDREKSTWEKKQKELQAKIESIEVDFQHRERNFVDEIEYYKQEISKQGKRHKQQIDAMHSQLKEYEGWNSTLKSKNQGLEQEKESYASQIEKMSQIVSQLNSKGLPLPPDDTYFTQQLASLVSDIRAWARGFNKKRPALTIEEMNAIEINLPDEIKGYLIDSFHSFRDLLESKSVGTKLRTRCTEVILLRSLLSSYLHERYIGMDKKTYATIQSIRSSLHASDKEIRYWSALTSHLYTKTNPLLDAQQDLEATQITEYLYTALSHFNDSPSRATKSTEASLKKIVLRVAKLGMEIAQLPFCVVPGNYRPGCRLRPENMEDIDSVDEDGDVDVNDEEKRTSIVLTPVWLKVVFDEEGREMTEKGQMILLCKASVSCLT